MYICMYICIQMYIYMYVYKYLCMYVCMYVCILMHMCILIIIRTRKRICIYMYLYIYHCFGNPQIRVHYCIDRDTVHNQKTRASHGSLVTLFTQNLRHISKQTTNVQT